MRQTEDTELIALIAQQNEAALDALYDRYHRLVFSVALAIVHRREEAEEITLDIFTTVWRKAGTYRSDKAKVSTWLTRMTRNRAIDILRREEIRPLKHSVEWASRPALMAYASETTEEAAALKFERQRIREAMILLSENQREVLALAYFGGYSHTEIARVLDLPLGTVKGRIRSAMQRLRACLRDE